MIWAASALAVSEPPQSSTVSASLVQIDEARHLGAPVRADVLLTDEQGRDFKLGDMLGKPVILLLSYYGCDGTCPTMNGELAKVLEKVERFRLGRDYRVLTVSFDPRDSDRTAHQFLTKTGAVTDAMRAGWRHAVLADRGTTAFAASVGFKFFWSDAGKAFMHSNVLVFLTPEGRVARYIYGTRMDARTIELALTEADWNRISSSTALFDILTGACFSYNYSEGRYQPNYAQLIGFASFLLGLGLIVLGLWSYRQGRGRTNA